MKIEKTCRRYTLPALCVCLVLMLVGVTIRQEVFAQTSPFGAPKTAPDRRLRLQRPVAEEGSNDAPLTNAGATTVSLQGGVSRLDASASQQGGMGPLSGKIESMIDTPLQSQKPSSQQVPPEVFRGWLENSHPNFALNASKYSESAIVVIKGQWDDSSKTLKKLQIPHTRIGGGKLMSFPLHSTSIVIVDCPGDLTREACQKLRDFVSRGGYVLSTDWALDHFTGPTFNEYVQWNSGVNHRDMVDATVFDTDPVLFAHTVTNAYWKLDIDSHLIKIMNRDAVRVLAKSSQLVHDDPDHEGVLAVVFPFGRGYVMHMIGHFDNNAKIAIGNFLPDPAPSIKISLRQALAANFIVAALEKTRIATNHRRN